MRINKETAPRTTHKRRRRRRAAQSFCAASARVTRKSAATAGSIAGQQQRTFSGDECQTVTAIKGDRCHSPSRISLVPFLVLVRLLMGRAAGAECCGVVPNIYIYLYRSSGADHHKADPNKRESDGRDGDTAWLIFSSPYRAAHEQILDVRGLIRRIVSIWSGSTPGGRQQGADDAVPGSLEPINTRAHTHTQAVERSNSFAFDDCYGGFREQSTRLPSPASLAESARHPGRASGAQC